MNEKAKECTACEGTGKTLDSRPGEAPNYGENCSWCGGSGVRAPELSGALVRGHGENRGHFRRFWMAYLIVALMLAAGVACAGALSRILRDDVDTSGWRDRGVATSSAPDPTATARPSSKTGGAVTRFGEGVFLVGKDIKAGRYRAKPPSGAAEFGCYWQRMKGVTGEPADIIANGFVSPGGQVTIEIKPGDVAFESHGCGDWTRA